MGSPLSKEEQSSSAHPEKTTLHPQRCRGQGAGAAGSVLPQPTHSVSLRQGDRTSWFAWDHPGIHPFFRYNSQQALFHSQKFPAASHKLHVHPTHGRPLSPQRKAPEATLVRVQMPKTLLSPRDGLPVGLGSQFPHSSKAASGRGLSGPCDTGLLSPLLTHL